MFCMSHKISHMLTKCTTSMLSAIRPSTLPNRWEEHHNTCGLCRAILLQRDDFGAASQQQAELARQEILESRLHVDTNRIARDVLNMTREEVIQRLRTLINSPNLEEQLGRVRDHIPLFSSFSIERATQHMDDIEVYIRTFIFVIYFL